MREPRPTDFDLTDDAVAYWHDFAENRCLSIGFRIAAIMSSVVLALVIGNASSVWAGVFDALWPVMLIMFFGSMIASSIVEAVTARFTPAFRQYKVFIDVQKKYRDWELRTRAAFWTGLRGMEFEREFGRLLQMHGFEVVLTGGSGDGGVDLIASRSGRMLIVQCKAHAKPVGPAVVREVWGTLMDSQADGAIVATVGGATRGAYEFASGKPIRILDLKDLIDLQTARSSPATVLLDQLIHAAQRAS